jgi:hypothetical protein
MAHKVRKAPIQALQVLRESSALRAWLDISGWTEFRATKDGRESSVNKVGKAKAYKVRREIREFSDTKALPEIPVITG